MSRLKGTLIQNQSYAQGRDGQSPQIDVSLGGQYGYQPNFSAYVSNTGYTPRNLISLLVEAPRGLRGLEAHRRKCIIVYALRIPPRPPASLEAWRYEHSSIVT